MCPREGAVKGLDVNSDTLAQALPEVVLAFLENVDEAAEVLTKVLRITKVL